LKKKDVLDEKAIAKVKPSDTCTVVSKQGEKTLFVSSDFTRNGAGAIATRNTRRAFSAVKVAIASLVAVAVAVYIDVFDFPVKKQRERGRGRERERRSLDSNTSRKEGITVVGRRIGLNGLSKYGLTHKPKFKVLGYVYGAVL
jgi:hypothetical protein